MTELLPLKTGDWAVLRTRYECEVTEVRRVTDQCFYAAARYSSRDHRYSRHDVIFAGREDIAKLLCQRLVSSYAQWQDERRSAGDRKTKRDEDFVSQARAAQDQAAAA